MHPDTAVCYTLDMRQHKMKQTILFARASATILLAVLLFVSAGQSAALADPESTSPSPTPTSSRASTQGDASASPTASAAEDIIIRVGNEGDHVILLQLRLRDLGYYNYKITGFFGNFTKESVADFQKTNGIDSDGIAGAKTLEVLYSNAAKRKPIEPLIKPTPKPVISGGKVKYGALKDWFSYVSSRWPRGTTYKVVDLNTRKSYNMTRVGGQLHADVAPKTKKDTEIFKSTYGGSWGWDRRAVIVYVKGEAIAASINGEPHGSTGVPGNGMNLANGHLQQVCIHFLNSRTHIHNMRDPAHQAQVRRAAGK